MAAARTLARRRMGACETTPPATHRNPHATPHKPNRNRPPSPLPMIFRRLGFDPAYASSPFVATFVDVTGIVIYFSIAKVYLL